MEKRPEEPQRGLTGLRREIDEVVNFARAREAQGRVYQPAW